MSKLVIYASCGQGHKFAALSIAEHIKAEAVDFLDFTHPLIKFFYSRGYVFITNYFPFLWKILFEIFRLKIVRYFINKTHFIFFSPFLTYLLSLHPETVVLTHFFPISFLDKIKEKLKCKLVVYITDFGVHPYWVSKKVDYYLVASHLTKNLLMEKGIEENKIASGYIPVRKEFLSTYPQNIRFKFFPEKRKTLLFVSSKRGRFPFINKLLPQLLKEYNIFVIYGENKRLRKYLSKIKSPNLYLFSYCKNIWEVISASDIIVTKPGGLTVFEGLYKKKLFIFTHYIPGQEEENMKFLESLCLGKFVSSADDFMKSLNYFLSHQEYLLKNYPLNLKPIFEIALTYF